MANIVNTDKISFVLTNYGLGRVAAALEDPTVTLNISKIKIGDANGEYYTPSAEQVSLVHPITNGSFYVIEKALLEDNETVSFRAVISETSGGYDIREVGLYETYLDEDHLFAIGTQQPFVKPSSDYNYFINLDYSIFLKSVNLADVYDQIILNPDNQLVTEEDLEELMSTVLFSQGNLSVQIGDNSKIIGLNRATQLYDRLQQNAENLGYATVYSNFSDLLNVVSSNNIFGYWVFNYPRRISFTNSIVDISTHSNYLSSNMAINVYDRSYAGIMAMLDFKAPNYFFLDSSVEMSFVDTTTNKDTPFSMVFAIKPKTVNSKRTLLARSNYATGSHVFEVNETANRELEIILFSDTNNYVRFISGENLVPEEAHTVAFSYDKDLCLITAYMNGKKVTLNKEVTGTYTHMSTSPTTLYCFSCYPYEVIYANSSTNPVTNLYNADGSPYTGNEWSMSGGVKYKTNSATYEASKNVALEKMYAWNYNDGVYDHTVYTKVATIESATTPLYNSNYTRAASTEFEVRYDEDSSSYKAFYVPDNEATAYDSTKNINAKTIYAWQYTFPIEKIWGNSSTTPTLLFDSTGVLYTETDWTIVNGVPTYKTKFSGTYNSAFNIIIPVLEATSYITNSSGIKAQLINSEIGVISVIKEELSEDNLRSISLSLETQMGKSPVVIIN